MCSDERYGRESEIKIKMVGWRKREIRATTDVKWRERERKTKERWRDCHKEEIEQKEEEREQGKRECDSTKISCTFAQRRRDIKTSKTNARG